jgi:hypothetical protein
MSIFGQVWLWSLLAFVIGAVLTWLVLVLPARKRIRSLESRLAVAHAETTRAAVQPVPQVAETDPTATTYLERHVIGSPEADPYGEPATIEPAFHAEPALAESELEIHRETDPFEEQFAEFDQLAEQPASQPTFEPEPERSISPPTEYFQPSPEPEPQAQPEPESEPEPEFESGPSVADTLEPSVGESLFQPGLEPEHEQHPEPEPLVPRWFDRDEEEPPERSPFEEPSSHSYFDESPVTEHFQPPAAAPRHAEPVAENGAHEAPQFGGIEPLPEAEPLETTYAFGSADRPEPSVPAETPMEATQILPKRQRRESPRGGFDPPRPIQPSMRAVERREPTELTGGHSGSLFEPSVPPNQQAPLPPEPAASRHQVTDSAVPAGPFGPGSAMPRPGGGRPADEFGVKASVTALRYCTEDSAQFPRMVAEVWFRTPEDAERVGFRPLT